MSISFKKLKLKETKLARLIVSIVNFFDNNTDGVIMKTDFSYYKPILRLISQHRVPINFLINTEEEFLKLIDFANRMGINVLLNTCPSYPLIISYDLITGTLDLNQKGNNQISDFQKINTIFTKISLQYGDNTSNTANKTKEEDVKANALKKAKKRKL